MVVMGKWSDDLVMMFVVVWCLALWLVYLCLVLTWSELQMTSAISWPLWS